jgi:hypothetical protein
LAKTAANQYADRRKLAVVTAFYWFSQIVSKGQATSISCWLGQHLFVGKTSDYFLCKQELGIILLSKGAATENVYGG